MTKEEIVKLIKEKEKLYDKQSKGPEGVSKENYWIQKGAWMAMKKLLEEIGEYH